MENSRYPNKTIVRITPNIEDLIPHKRMQCPEIDCMQIFSNVGNLQLHLTRHHKKVKLEKSIDVLWNTVKLYYCPSNDCIYNERVEHGGRYFTNMKYVRQHYQKVHIAKTFQCSKCDKSFGTIGQHKAHELNCGKIYQCSKCDCNYSTSEALLTHVKRKKHMNRDEKKQIHLMRIQNSKIPKFKLPPFQKTKWYQANDPSDKTPMKTELNIKSENQLICQQDIRNNSIITGSTTTSCLPLPSNLIQCPTNLQCVYLVQVPFEAKDQGCQTESHVDYNDKIAEKSIDNILKKSTAQTNFDYTYSPPSNINNTTATSNFELYEAERSAESELTQSESQSQQQYPYQQNGDLSNYYENSCFDQMVSSSNFCDIETQTEYPSVLDELLYSTTQTQTCKDFLQEFGLTNIQTQTNWSTMSNEDLNNVGGNSNGGGGGVGGSSGAHDEFLVSTETQTSFTQCLLDCNNTCNLQNNNCGGNNSGIAQHTQTCDTLLDGLFGGHDFIGNFQSTYTQT